MGDRPFKSRLEQADQTLSEIYDGHHLIGFRDDVEEIWVKNRGGKSWDEDSETVPQEVKVAVEQSRQRWLTVEDGLNKIQLVDGVTGGIIAVFLFMILTKLGLTQVPSLAISSLVFLIFTLLNHGILYTKAIVNRVCYLDASARESESRLIFKRGWNQGVLSSNSSIIGILFVALARRFCRRAYEIGLDLVEELDEELHC